MAIATKKRAPTKHEAPEKPTKGAPSVDGDAAKVEQPAMGTAGKTVQMIPLESLIPAEDNVRSAERLDPTSPEILAMAITMKEAGVLEPLLVEPHPFEEGSFRIKAGGRRFVAAGVAGLPAAPCLVEEVDEAVRQSIFVIENTHREGLSPIELARGLQQMVDTGLTQREVAQRAGISQPHVSKLTALLKLPGHVQEAVNGYKMTQDDALALSKLPAKIVKELCADEVVPDSFDIRSATIRAEQQAKHDAAVKKAQDAGFPLLDEHPDEWFQGSFTAAGPDGTETVPESAAVALNGRWGTLGHVDPEEHESEDCHAVFVRPDGTVMPACTNHEAHPKPEADDEDEDDDDAAPGVPGGYQAQANPAYEAGKQALESLEPTIKRALATGALPEQVLAFVARALLRDNDPWVTARRAADLLDLTGTTEDPLEDLAVLSDDDAATALTAFALDYYAGALRQVVCDVAQSQTPLDVMEFSDDEELKASVADARRLLNFLREVVPDDGIGTLEDIVADFAEAEDEQLDPSIASDDADSDEDLTATEDDEQHDPSEADDEDPTDATGADAPTQSSTDAEDAQPDGGGDEVTVHCIFGGCEHFVVGTPEATHDQMEEHYAEEHDVKAGAVVTVVKGGTAKSPKWFRDCSECGRLSGFNTSPGQAEKRAKEDHIDTDHGGNGSVVAA